MKKSKYHPFDDELQFKFYMNLPDFKKHVISQEEAQEIQRIETIENEELMSIELKKQQEINNQLEREGKMPNPLPDEAQLLAKVQEMKSRSINQWMDCRFDEFMRKSNKNQSQEQMDKKAEDFIEGNNSVHMKMPRKRIAKIIFNVCKNNSSNLQLLPNFARFIAIVNQYFPEIGIDTVGLLQTEFSELLSTEQSDLINYDIKIRNIRFQGELAKFAIYPPEKILENMKQCLDNFYGQNIEIICNLLESCGRYLLASLEKETL